MSRNEYDVLRVGLVARQTAYDAMQTVFLVDQHSLRIACTKIQLSHGFPRKQKSLSLRVS